MASQKEICCSYMVEVQHLHFISRNSGIFVNFNYSMSSKKNLIICFQHCDTDIFQYHSIFRYTFIPGYITNLHFIMLTFFLHIFSFSHYFFQCFLACKLHIVCNCVWVCFITTIFLMQASSIYKKKLETWMCIIRRFRCVANMH